MMVLSCSNWILTNYLCLIKPPMNFTLKWINVFFIPSFIILPLSDHITIIECMKIASVFVFGMIVLILVNIYFIAFLKFVYGNLGVFKEEKAEFEKEEELESELELESIQGNNSIRDDVTTIDVNSLRSVQTTPALSLSPPPLPPRDSTLLNKNPFLLEPERIYHKTHHVENNTSYPSLQQHRYQQSSRHSISSKTSSNKETVALESTEVSPITSFITRYIDWILYIFLFLVSLPFYYIPSIHTFLPYHLSLTILAYYIAVLIPQYYPKTKKFAHPILVSTAIILFTCFIGSLIYHHEPRGFLEDLRFYKTGKNYLNLFNGQEAMNNKNKEFTSTPQWPGCGDFLSSLMDVSIVALSLPMFTHRRDFIKNFWILMPTILVSAGATFFIYPIVCHALGIQPQRSIGFIGRSVTLALGTPLIESLGGSVSLMAVCTILSGICGVLINEPLFKFFRVAKEDYLTRGVTMGLNCGAIATAHLLNIDPRAASTSSLSFTVFGTVMIIMAAIGSIRQLINELATLSPLASYDTIEQSERVEHRTATDTIEQREIVEHRTATDTIEQREIVEHRTATDTIEQREIVEHRTATDTIEQREIVEHRTATDTIEQREIVEHRTATDTIDTI
ncbi:hypothetical protein KGF56_001073 [Candida oxycetoniae]|uniref:LrgB-like protein n=1 Tax=Candida oxycetoniae TaxID=497107 RepID=A0AAI9SZT6_9ASCO|nr:uncharacterized protein KGF56_001073 [Candida oxycetoniae]KAI3406231.2 hypothetical protein KGF56_001073 [Candida oxycetoniae]